MTSLYLLLWIAGSISLQIAIYLAIGFVRHWQELQTLRTAVANSNISLPHVAASAPEAMTTAWPGLRNFRVIRKVPEDATRQVFSFYLAPEDGQQLQPFLPGQFLTFRLDIPSHKGGNESVIRCYSLSDAPHQDNYRVSIKRAPAPAGSGLPAGLASSFFHDQVGVGRVLQVRAPAGHFHIDQSRAPVVLIGGGIGITPMLSMLNWCLAEQPGREVWLFYGVRNSTELVMQTHLQTLAAAHPHFHLHWCFSDPLASDRTDDPTQYGQVHHGRVDVALMRRLLPLKPYHFYLCGPTPLLQSLVPALEDWGVPDAHIHFEAFGPASIARKKSPALPQAMGVATGAEAAVTVTFSKSAKQLSWQPGMGSLLDFAEAHGIAVSSGCRAGGCGSCQTTIQAGEVSYTQTPDYDPEPGSCLLCVCTPKTALTLEA